MPIDFGSLIGTILGARPDLTTALTGGQFNPGQPAVAAQPDPNNPNQQPGPALTPYEQKLNSIVGTPVFSNQVPMAPDPTGVYQYAGKGAIQAREATPPSYTPITMSPSEQRWDAIMNGGGLTNATTSANVEGRRMVGQNMLTKDQAQAQNLLNLALQRNLNPQDSAKLEPGYAGVAQSGQGAQQAGNEAAKNEAIYRAAMARGQTPGAEQLGSSDTNRRIQENIAGGTTAQNIAQTEKATQPTRLETTLAEGKYKLSDVRNALYNQPYLQHLATIIARMGSDNANNVAVNSFPMSPNRANPYTGEPMANATTMMQYMMGGQQAYKKEAGTEQGKMDAIKQWMKDFDNTNAVPSYRPPSTAQPIGPNGYAIPGVSVGGLPILPPQQ